MSPHITSLPSRKCGALDFDRHVLRKCLHGDAAPGRLVHEVLLIHPVHLSEVAHVVNEDIDLFRCQWNVS